MSIAKSKNHIRRDDRFHCSPDCGQRKCRQSLQTDSYCSRTGEQNPYSNPGTVGVSTTVPREVRLRNNRNHACQLRHHGIRPLGRNSLHMDGSLAHAHCSHTKSQQSIGYPDHQWIGHSSCRPCNTQGCRCSPAAAAFSRVVAYSNLDLQRTRGRRVGTLGGCNANCKKQSHYDSYPRNRIDLAKLARGIFLDVHRNSPFQVK